MAAILIVEDDSPARAELVERLARSGHVVTIADGAVALERARETRAELAILDEAGYDGLELAAGIKAVGSGFAPVLLIVARPDPETRAQALAVVDDVVARPWAPIEVVARVQALLRTRAIVDELRRVRAEAEARSLADGVTGLRNRVFLVERLNEEYKRSLRYNEPLSLLLLGIEGLREASESRGAAFSDRLVAQVAHAAQRSLRQIDVLCRYGPGELAALLPSTHFAGSLVCADRLARELPSSGLDGFVPRVSMGLSFCPGKDVAEPADLLRIASRALDRARAEGPGNICLYQHQGYLYLPKLT